jgi:tripartite-type tricarboxylate transporter receptor subunit TctC
MILPRRKFLHLAVGATILPALSREARAQTYPTRPITMVVPAAAGGTSDAIGRVVAERMKEVLGEPIIIENAGGANGTIGVGRVARAKPDGYTIDLGNISSHVFNGAFYTLTYDLLNDFAPILALITTPFILFGRRSMPAEDLRELITWLKINPNKASAATSLASHRLLFTFLQRETGTQFTLVPYRGGAPSMQDLMAGRIDMLLLPPENLALMRTGSIKAYAVTSDTRLALAPDIPTFGEMGLPTLSYSGWTGLFAPRNTPIGVIEKLNAAAAETLTDLTVRSRLADLGLGIFPPEQQTPRRLSELVKADAEKWWPLIKEFGIMAQ